MTMAQKTAPRSRPSSRSWFSPALTLAVWRLRATWRMLLVTGLGMLAAVVLICTVPLYVQVALTAGLQGVLTATPQDAELNVNAEAKTLTTESVAEETREFTAVIQQNLRAYLTNTSEFFIQMPPLSDAALDPANQIVLTGTALTQAASHLTLSQGRLPQMGSDALEVALTPETATALGVHVGDTLPLLFQFPTLNGAVTETLAFHVVGLFHPSPRDLFWHGNTFEPEALGPFINYPALMSSDALVTTLTRLALKDQDSDGIVLTDAASLNWYYHLNPPQIDSTQLDDVIAQIALTQTYLDNRAAGESAYLISLRLLGPAVEAFGASSTLTRFRDRVAVIRIPVGILALQMGGLVLFFASLMAELLIEQQTEAIAILRSRGASRRQILGSLAVQSAGLAALALILGPLLALGGAWALAHITLSPAEQGALNVLARNPLSLMLGVGWEALAAAICASLAVIAAVRGASRHSLLDVRRDAAREGQRPLWQRWYLDIVAAVLALLGYGVSLYVTQAGVADARVDLLISTPLVLIAPLLLGLAGLLCVLRFFSPVIARLARVASRRSTAAPVLALAQLARAPRRALRLVLLLGLTSSFAIFSLVFTATEPQQLANVAAYQVGADFSGRLSGTVVTASTLAEQTAAYRALPGVISASGGYVTDVSIQQTTVEMLAVDSRTFAQTALWSSQDSSESLPALMALLTNQHALASGKVPVIVDALTWERLHVALGAQLLLPVGVDATVSLIVVARVEHLPTVNDSLVTAGTSDYTPPGGMLLDFQTLAGRASSLGQFLSPNTIWLRTRDDAATLARIREALSNGPLQLSNLQDRRLMLAVFLADPLYLTLKGVLALGALATLVLALAGALFASWVHARRRLTTFAVLRALGMEPREIARVFAWEQGLIYAGALLLGLAFGVLLVASMVPALAFVGSPSYGSALSSGEFYVLQHVLPTQIVLPLSLGLVLGVLIALGGSALWMMAWMVSRPALAQTLRLNED
jgi:putative ABC transport system permease protein